MSVNASIFQLKKAAFVCNHGGVISYPTESVFGLGCNPDDFSAVEKLLSLKQRPIGKGLILIAADIDQLLPYIIVSDNDCEKIISNQTIPTTWLIEPSELTPVWITGQHKKVAVRITRHPVAKQLCALIDYPLVSTSANTAKKMPARSSLKSRIYFGDGVDFYIGGRTGNSACVSQIIDLNSGVIVRDSLG